MMDIIYISTVVNVGLYLVLMTVRSKWIKVLRDLVSNVLSITFFIILLNIYPFEVMGLIVLASITDLVKHLSKFAKQAK